MTIKVKDEKAIADLVTQKAALEKQFADLSDSLQHQYESDAWKNEDGTRSEKYDVDQLRHGELARNIKKVSDELMIHEQLAPAKKGSAKAYEDEAFKLFIEGGGRALAQEEYNEFIDESAGGNHGEVFILKQEGEGTMGASRSDDQTAKEITDDTVRTSILEVLNQFGGINKMAQMFTTATGNELRVPTQDDASAKGRLLTNQDEEMHENKIPDFGSILFGAATMTTDTIPITRELLQDSFINVAGYATRTIGRRTARGWDELFTLGGVVPGEIDGKPAETKAPATAGIIGVSNVAQKGITTTTANTITWDNLVDMIYTIDPAYLMGGEGMGGLSAERGGRIGWLISHDCERILRRMKDGDGRPLWQAMGGGLGSPGMGPQIAGYPYVMSNVMPKVATGNVPALFGNFSYYAIRRVHGLQVFRFLDSGTMKRNRIEMIGLSRCWGQAMFPGQPVQGSTATKTAYGGIPQISKLTIK